MPLLLNNSPRTLAKALTVAAIFLEVNCDGMKGRLSICYSLQLTVWRLNQRKKPKASTQTAFQERNLVCSAATNVLAGGRERLGE